VRTVPADEHAERDRVTVGAAFDEGGVRQGRQGVSVAQGLLLRVSPAMFFRVRT